MSRKTQPQPPTQFGQILTQAMQTIQAGLNWGSVRVKKDAQVAQLRVYAGRGNGEPEIYPLLGDRYIVGRSSRSSDIVVPSPLVSQTHFSLERNSSKSNFTLKDQDSTNGVYLGKQRLQTLALRHGDRLTLGPKELEDVVEIEYYNPPPLWMLILRYSLYSSGGLLGLFLLWLGIEWTKIPVRPLPTGISGPVVVYARDGQTPLSPLRKETHKEKKSLAEFSPYLPKAVIASEDSRYYWHFGVDPWGVLRAVVINVRGGGVRQGASTLTQQLARSLFPEVGRENTALRKLREMIVALKLEFFYSKDELLKTYLNRVYLGVSSYGFEDAAQFYFDKSAKDLTIAEAATLVAILPAPNAYNPVQDYETAVGLRNRVINRMVALGMISEQEGARARRSRIEVSPEARETLSNTIAPYFYSYVFQELETLLGGDLAKEGNFIVETGLDLKAQKEAETALRDAVNNRGATYRFSQGALVTLDSRTGEIRALAGGVDYGKSQFNRATQAQRQPGSTFKVFAYAAALEKGISPWKVYSCAGLNWRGQNYKPCERSSGGADMYRGLAQSENAIALRVAQDAGLDRVLAMAQRLGIKSELNPVPGLILGQSEVNVLEITGAYTAFANGGVWSRPHAIRRILDGGDCTDYNNPKTCREIYVFAKDATGTKRAFPSAIAHTMTDMMQQVITRGTGKAASLGKGEAGKTGTTNNYVDLWFIGYLPSRHLVTGIWLGNDDNSPTKGSSGQAAKLWGDYMEKF
jgi:1A family penicillin-binding protein